mmetsp:Transcript_22230/g.25739  ORF Transcript_22230/g.25739 Transcript_22230/m.25739 type:complete len:199 (-) Transcript_22230:581-1177(-)
MDNSCDDNDDEDDDDVVVDVAVVDVVFNKVMMDRVPINLFESPINASRQSLNLETKFGYVFDKVHNSLIVLSRAAGLRDDNSNCRMESAGWMSCGCACGNLQIALAASKATISDSCLRHDVRNVNPMVHSCDASAMDVVYVVEVWTLAIDDDDDTDDEGWIWMLVRPDKISSWSSLAVYRIKHVIANGDVIVGLPVLL